MEYVIDCRWRGTLQNQYAVVEGGVANGNVIDTVEDYENGVITAEQALGQFYSTNVYRQLSDPKYGLHRMSNQYMYWKILLQN